MTKHCTKVFADEMAKWRENADNPDDQTKMPNILTVQKIECEKKLNDPNLSDNVRKAVEAEKIRKKLESSDCAVLKFEDGVLEEERDRLCLAATYAK